ncbi:MAG: hypothetical protein QXJ93_01525 [Candidatus Rehaiarchaeum fermentans]|nr:hypothetical protein [Candidatus Rehaiarchaeum fermentans]
MVDKYHLIGAIIKSTFIATAGGFVAYALLNKAHVGSPYDEIGYAAVSWAIFGGIVYYYYKKYKEDEGKEWSNSNDSDNSNLDKILKQGYKI